MTRSFELVLAVLVFALLVRDSQCIEARYSFVDVVMDTYPLDYPSTSTAALIEIDFNAPLYVRTGRCSTNNLCSSSNFFPCCRNPAVECDRVTLRSNNASCVCASRADRVCVDPWMPYVWNGPEYLMQTPDEPIYAFEIPLVKACHNMIIDAGGLIGSWSIFLNLNLGSAAEDILSPVAVVGMLGTNSIGLCANSSDGDHQNSGSNTLDFWLSSVAPDGVSRIYGTVNGWGHFNLTVQELIDPIGLVPLASGGHARQILPTLVCPKSVTPFYLYPPPYLPVILPSTAMPALDYLLSLACLKGIPDADLLPNKIALLVSYSEDGLGPFTPNAGSLENCSLDLSMLMDGSGHVRIRL